MRQLLKAFISFGLIGCLVLSPIEFVPITDLTVQSKSTTVTTERVITEYTKVYASRSKKAKVILPLTFGTIVYHNATSGSWTKITYKGNTGWVPSATLMPSILSSSNTYLVKQTTSLFSTWSTKGKQITLLRFGDRAVKLGEYGKWSRVRIDGKTGWLPSKYLYVQSSKKKISRTVYGSHTYGVDTQAEYDAVYKRVKAEFDAKYDSNEFGFDSYMHRVLNGERGTRDSSDPAYRTPNNGGLLMAEMALEPYFDGRLSMKTYEKMYRTNSFLHYIYSKYDSKSVEGDPHLKSAYDVLFRGKSDCDSSEQVKSLVYDLAGIDNVIIGDGVTHALLLFKVDEGWMGSSYTAYTTKDIDSTNALNIYVSFTQKGTRMSY